VSEIWDVFAIESWMDGWWCE